MSETRDLVGNLLDGRYRLVEILGSGGSGKIYKAIDERSGRGIALKVLNHSDIEGEESAERFQNEVAVTAHLTNPHNIRVDHCGRSKSGLLYLAMELLEGKPLSDLLPELAPMPLARAVPILEQILEALAEAHDLGIVHGDMKPANIVLQSDENGSDFVKVVDYGIATFLRKDAGSKPHMTKGTVLGTPLYFSPEQALGRPLTPASDIYSLGVALFEMLTGRTPFNAESSIALGMKHIYEPPPLAWLNPTDPASRGLKSVLASMLEKQASSRPADARALSKLLQEKGVEGEGRFEIVFHSQPPTPASSQGEGDVSVEPEYSGDPERKVRSKADTQPLRPIRQSRKEGVPGELPEATPDTATARAEPTRTDDPALDSETIRYLPDVGGALEPNDFDDPRIEEAPLSGESDKLEGPDSVQSEAIELEETTAGIKVGGAEGKGKKKKKRKKKGQKDDKGEDGSRVAQGQEGSDGAEKSTPTRPDLPKHMIDSVELSQTPSGTWLAIEAEETGEIMEDVALLAESGEWKAQTPKKTAQDGFADTGREEGKSLATDTEGTFPEPSPDQIPTVVEQPSSLHLEEEQGSPGTVEADPEEADKEPVTASAFEAVAPLKGGIYAPKRRQEDRARAATGEGYGDFMGNGGRRLNLGQRGIGGHASSTGTGARFDPDEDFSDFDPEPRRKEQGLGALAWGTLILLLLLALFVLYALMATGKKAEEPLATAGIRAEIVPAPQGGTEGYGNIM